MATGGHIHATLQSRQQAPDVFSKKPWVKDYARLLKVLSAASLQIHLNILLLSEVTNAILRREYWLYLKASGVKKASYKRNFRITSHFEPAKTRMLQAVRKQILPFSTLTDLPSMALDQLVDRLDTHDMEFNDAAHAEFCFQMNAIFVTDDLDFRKAPVNIEVWSANPDASQP